MKLSKNIFIALLICGIYAQDGGAADTWPEQPAEADRGSCANGCVNCNTNGEIEWCLACYKSKHVMTSAINGKCEGTETGITNCLISYVYDGSQHCAVCQNGYGIQVENVAADSANDMRAYTKGHTCKKLVDTNAVTGYSYKPTGDDAKYQDHSTSCKYGFDTQYFSATDSLPATTTCQPTTNNQNYDENCEGWSGSSCSRCTGSNVKVSEFSNMCLPIFLNAGGISGSSVSEPYFGKYSQYLNKKSGFYWSDDIKVVSHSGGSNGIKPQNSFTSSGNPYQGTLGYCSNCFGVATSADFGTVGDGAEKSGNLIACVGLILTFFLFK